MGGKHDGAVYMNSARVSDDRSVWYAIWPYERTENNVSKPTPLVPFVPLTPTASPFLSNKARYNAVAWEFRMRSYFFANSSESRTHHDFPYVHKTPVAGCPWPLSRLTLLSFDPVLKRISEQYRALRLGVYSFFAQSSA